MDNATLLAAITVIGLVHFAMVGRFQGLLTIDSLFVIAQWAMAAGTLTLLDPTNEADRVYALVITIPLALYVITSIITHFSLRSGRRREYSGLARIVWAYRPTTAISALLLLAGAVTLLYFRAVGYNTFILGIRGLFTGVVEDYTTLRLDSYSPARYLYPGYVNQFKNTILPALAVVISIYLTALRLPLRKTIITSLAVLVTVSLLGTGQRGAFVLFCLTLLVFLHLLDRRKFPHRASLGALVATPLLLVATTILGRSSAALEHAPGPLGKILTLASELVQRFFHDNQFSGQMAFRYTYGQPVQNGKEWLTAVAGVLPDNPGSPLASEVFHYLYGTYRGTAPPSLWGSTYFNFGWIGLVLISIALGAAFQVVTFRAINKPEVNTLELIGMAGAFATFGTWIAGGPEYLLNSGALAFAILWWVGWRSAHLNLQIAPPLARYAGDQHTPRKPVAFSRIPNVPGTGR